MVRTPELGFRALREADIPALHAWLVGAGLGVPPRLDLAVWGRRLLHDSRILVTTATFDELPVGFLRLDLAPDRTAEVSLIVAARERRQGIGAALLAHALDDARARGLRRLFAVVADGNDRGRKFFSDRGFEMSSSTVPGFEHLARYVHRSDRQQPLEIVP